MFFHSNIYINKSLMPFLILVVIFLLYTLITYFLHFQSPFYYLWGLRNNFRFYVAFFAFVLLLQWEDVKQWFKALDWLYLINFFAIVVQFLQGKERDYVGGIFGVQKGSNGALMVFLTVVVAKTIIEFMRGEQKFSKCLGVSATSLFISAVSELKFFFIAFVFILLISSIMTRQTIKKTLFWLLCVVMIAIFASLLSTIYKEFSGFLSIENLWKSIFQSSYATDEDIGRITAIPYISENFLTGFWDKLFGMGLGNCDYSSLAIFNTPFSVTYAHTHYLIFLYAFLYIETGLIGLALYLAFIVLCLIKYIGFYRRKQADETICLIAIIFSILCIFFCIYDVSLRVEIGYLAYFVLALPFISARRGTRI